MRIEVRNNNVDRAIRELKKNLQKEGFYRELKSREFFPKPLDVCVI